MVRGGSAVLHRQRHRGVAILQPTPKEGIIVAVIGRSREQALLAVLGDSAWGVQWVALRGEKTATKRQFRLWGETVRAYRAYRRRTPWKSMDPADRIEPTPRGVVRAVVRLHRNARPMVPVFPYAYRL